MTEPQNLRTSEPRYTYRNLVLWQQAQEFAQAIVELVDRLPASRSVDTIARQLVRSATSVAANIAEGHGRFGVASYRNHLSIAKGSACEADSWLDLLRRLNLIAPQYEAKLHERCAALIASLTGRIRDLERMPTKKIREQPADYGSISGVEDDLAGSEVQGF